MVTATKVRVDSMDSPESIQRKSLPKVGNTVIIWQGASLLDGAPIVALLSGLKTPSDNGKTGPMAQVDILRADVHPMEAVKLGLDSSICGECPLRSINGVRVCYVNLFFAPSSKWKAYNRGSYPILTPEQAGELCKSKGIGIRDGAYGDPATVPFEIWDRLHKAAGTFHTSYTHQWARPDFNTSLFNYAMASVDDVNTVAKLRELHPDARYYRLAKAYNDIDSETEVKCPSKNAAGKRVLTCARCKLCSGNSLNAKNVVIVEND